MRYLPDAKQMKTADSFTINELKIPSLELMERAARACVDHIKDWKINLNKIKRDNMCNYNQCFIKKIHVKIFFKILNIVWTES